MRRDAAARARLICGARRRRRGRGQLRGSAPRSDSEILLKSIWLSRRIRHRRIHYACRRLQGRVDAGRGIKTPAGASETRHAVQLRRCRLKNQPSARQLRDAGLVDNRTGFTLLNFFRCGSLLILVAERGGDERLDVGGQCSPVLRGLALSALDGGCREVKVQLGVGAVLGDLAKLGGVLVGGEVLRSPCARVVVGEWVNLLAAARLTRAGRLGILRSGAALAVQKVLAGALAVQVLGPTEEPVAQTGADTADAAGGVGVVDLAVDDLFHFSRSSTKTIMSGSRTTLPSSSYMAQAPPSSPLLAMSTQ
nr:MAG TPA: hypothetical protein [Caudoviricetes sp.]